MSLEHSTTLFELLDSNSFKVELFYIRTILSAFECSRASSKVSAVTDGKKHLWAVGLKLDKTTCCKEKKSVH